VMAPEKATQIGPFWIVSALARAARRRIEAVGTARFEAAHDQGRDAADRPPAPSARELPLVARAMALISMRLRADVSPASRRRPKRPPL
jgi:hypothetical protein